MQRILLGPQLVPAAATQPEEQEQADTTHLFFHVIFPLVNDVLSPDLDERRGAREMSDTRARVTTLLGKSFLHLELGSPPSSIHGEGGVGAFKEIWSIVLDFMERLMRSGGRRDHLVRCIAGRAFYTE